MAKNWALVIGINQYDFLQPLNYAKRDAQLMQEFLLGKEVGFEKVFFFSDDSPPVNGKSTRPNRSNLRQVLLGLFEKTDPPKMGAGDNFWFFFSGHGMRQNDRDYLMPSDGNPADIEDTGIPINFVSERLRRCGADNVVLILDACRNQGTRGEGIGRQTASVAQQTGVISIFSCSPNEYSYEIDALQQGAFTRVLLDGLGIEGKCATVERLNQYLSFRVPELVSHYKNARQTPYMVAEPVNKSHLILVPRYATLTDIATLKNDAYQAEVDKQLELAEQLWIRVLAAALGQDMDAIRGVQRIAQIRHYHYENTLSSSNDPSPTVESGGKSKSPTPTSVSQLPQIDDPKKELNIFRFSVVTVNNVGQEIKTKEDIAKYFTEDLGNNIALEMVEIPGGTFTMGSPEDELERRDSESPQHTVNIKQFCIGKYPVTQAQWRAVAALPQINRKLEPQPSHFKGDKRPVECVSWYEAVEFCLRLAAHTKRPYSLPSEAEWEYACRAGTKTPFHFGETITSELANYDANYTYGAGVKGTYREETTEVGSFGVANAFGLYDMHGNVWEWCLDDWHDNYEGAPTDCSAWFNENDNLSQKIGRAVLRGGSWFNGPSYCRSASRDFYAWAGRDDINTYIGFRVVCAVGRII